LLKNLFGPALLCLAKRFVRQQQRDEIMQCFAFFVNLFFATPQILRLLVLRQLLDFVVVFSRATLAGGEL
jgi:hypothetical protein